MRAETINWDAFSKLAHDPRGIPVSISATDATVDQVIAAAPRVQNHVPAGATWDGKTNLPMDEQTFQQMVSDSDPNAPATGAPTRGAPPKT